MTVDWFVKLSSDNAELRATIAAQAVRIKELDAALTRAGDVVARGDDVMATLRATIAAQAARIRELEMEAVLRNGVVKDDQRIIAALTQERDALQEALDNARDPRPMP